MLPFKADITINRPADEVFNFVADPGNYPKWMSGVSHAESLSTPLRNGAQVRIAGRMGPWNLDAPFEITSYKPGREFGMQGNGGAFTFKGKWNFEGGNGSPTHVTVEGEYKMLGLWRLVEPFFGGEVRNGEAQELAKIKAHLEG